MQTSNEKPVVLEVFRGVKDQTGKVSPVRRVGKCLFYQQTGHHVLHVDLLPGAAHTFHLKPVEGSSDFNICLKEALAKVPSRFVFRPVGTARLCNSPNEDLLYLEWDFIGPADIYLRTISVSDLMEVATA
jgi:hypothetical protein